MIPLDSYEDAINCFLQLCLMIASGWSIYMDTIMILGMRWPIIWPNWRRGMDFFSQEETSALPPGALSFLTYGWFLGIMMAFPSIVMKVLQYLLPNYHLPPPCKETPLELCHDPLEARFAISFATANVLSMSSRPHGHAGKVHYLREQLVSHGLNFAGFQETRGQAGRFFG